MIVAGTLTNKMAPALRKVYFIIIIIIIVLLILILVIIYIHILIKDTIKCQNLDGSFQWEVVQTEEDIIITAMQL